MTPIRIASIFCAAVAALHVAGHFLPTPLAWGFHSLAFLPAEFVFVYVLLAALCIAAAARGSFDRAVNRVAALADTRPRTFLATAIGLFLGCALLFRVEVPLLGDSFILIKTYANTAGGLHPFFAPREPLASYFFYLVIKFTGQTDFPEIRQAFLLGEVFLGAGFIINTFYATRLAFTSPRARLLSFSLLLVVPYVQLFFGYVEVYAVTLFLNSTLILLTLLFLKRKIPFSVLPPVMLVLVMAHYLNILLLPSMLYLSYREYKSAGAKNLFIGYGAAAALLTAVLLTVEVHRFLPASFQKPYLSITPGDDFQAYPLFSPYHAIDLGNMFILLCSAALGPALLCLRHPAPKADPMRTFLLMAILPVVACIVVVKFDLPMGIDWDVFAPYAAFLILGVLLYLFECFPEIQSRVIILLILIEALNSAVYCYVNSKTGPAIERASAFFDPRLMSREGAYQQTFHLTEYYDHIKNPHEIILASGRFIKLYGEDRKAHANLALYLMPYLKETSGPEIPATLDRTFNKWMELDSTNRQVRPQYALFQAEMGFRYNDGGDPTRAILAFGRATGLDPGLVPAFNGAGIAYRRLGLTDSAVVCFRKAIRLDPRYVSSIVNMANAQDDGGRPDSALRYYRMALALDSNSVSTYENMYVTYNKIGDRQNALRSLQRAAALGSIDAREELRREGLSW